jgi:hypothetical protein
MNPPYRLEPSPNIPGRWELWGLDLQQLPQMIEENLTREEAERRLSELEARVSAGKK